MMKKANVLLIAVILLAFSACGPKAGNDYIVAAYVWPSCHDDSLGRAMLWPDGRGEWEIIERGTPWFEGQYQPRQPLWGQLLDDDPEVAERWIRTALKYGVNTFIYDWYWFHHYPFLEGALDNGFLKAPSNGKMNFFIMYANHEVTNYWNPYINSDTETLTMDPRIDWDQWKIIVERVIRQYFHLPNYLKFDGRPVFGLYDPQMFIESFDTPEEAGRAMDYFRDEVRKAGFKDLYVTQHSGMFKVPNEWWEKRTQSNADALKLDAYAFYNMASRAEDYLEYARRGVEWRDLWEKRFSDRPVFPTASIGWDNTPRYPGQEVVVCRYNNTPEAFAASLQSAKEYADAHASTQPKMILINAWNEWVEGSYLLPDKLYGYRYLEAVRDVMRGKYE